MFKRPSVKVLRMFFEAVRKHKLNLVQEAINDGVDVNVKNWEEEFALLIAAYRGFDDVVKLLLDSGAEVNMRCEKDGTTALHAACNSGMKRVVDLLLMKNADVDVRTSTGETPLHCAFLSFQSSNYFEMRYRFDIIMKLLDKGANVNTSDRDGQTPLMMASQLGLVKIVSALLEKGADIKMQDSTGLFALHYACIGPSNNYLAVINSLLQSGCNVDCVDREWNTALHVACQAQNSGLILALINRGANINLKNLEGNTPLHFAIRFPNSAILDQLLISGAHVNALDIDGNTPLHLAAYRKHLGHIKTLLERGALTNVKNSHNKTPYELASHRAANYGRARELMAAHVLKLNMVGLSVFEANYDPNHISKNMHLAIQNEFAKIQSFKVTEDFFLKEVLMRQNSPFYFGNYEIMEKLEKLITHSNFTEQFPSFYYILRNFFEQSKMRFSLLVQASKLQVWKLGDVWLDDLVVHKILEYLTAEDLQNLVSVK